MVSKTGLEFIANTILNYANMLEFTIILDGSLPKNLEKSMKVVRKHCEKYKKGKTTNISMKMLALHEDEIEREARMEKSAK